MGLIIAFYSNINQCKCVYVTAKIAKQFCIEKTQKLLLIKFQ